MPVDYKAIGSGLMKARKAKGLTQKDVARRLRMTPANVSLIEKGATTPIENLEEYAAYVGCRLTILFGGADDDKAQLAARVAALLPGLEEPVVKTLRAWADLWEAEQQAERALRHS